MTKKSTIAAAQTAFSFEALSINQATKYSAYKGTCCRHSCNFGFYNGPYPLHRAEFY